MSTATLRIKLDKGRLRMLAAFRELLRGTGSVWITNHFVDHERNLVLCAPDEREKIATRFDRSP
jgi:DNA-binding transcriptional regulator/RsmH inhibitor MraZ